MMKTILFTAVALLLAFSASVGVAANESVSPEHRRHAVPAVENGSGEILVTYVDRSLERAVAGAPTSRYRRRGGDYAHSTWRERVADEISETYHMTLVAQWPIGELGVHCVVYDVTADTPVDTVMEALRHDERIESVQPMHRFRTMAAAADDPYLGLQKNLRLMQIETAHRWSVGRNVKIAVIDTGVDLGHPDLAGQVIAHKDFTTDDPARFSDDVHGTAVAGVIGAVASNGAGIVGVAPGAHLIALKACWSGTAGSLEAECTTLTLAQALSAAIRLKPDIINMSLAGPPDPLLQRLIERALKKGIVVVASATDGTGPDVGFPASMDGVIAVRTAPPHGQQRHAGTLLPHDCLAAPGMQILTTLPHSTYDFVSGSSLSAAHVSGVVALLLALDGDLPTGRVVDILQRSGAPAADDETAGFGPMVNACSAIAQVRRDKTACRTL